MMLNAFYDAMTDEIQRQQGTIDKFMGDAVMAVFGAPAGSEDHARSALRAAFSIRDRLRALFAGALSLRIGLATGVVMVGDSGEVHPS
jgi:adenylate cyclase